MLRTAEDISNAVQVISLRDYQWEGVNFLLDRGSALLADEMGLGKTVQVAVALSLLTREPRA
jgi:SNF2 family DNA or RNA helicase